MSDKKFPNEEIFEVSSRIGTTHNTFFNIRLEQSFFLDKHSGEKLLGGIDLWLTVGGNINADSEVLFKMPGMDSLQMDEIVDILVEARQKPREHEQSLLTK